MLFVDSVQPLQPLKKLLTPCVRCRNPTIDMTKILNNFFELRRFFVLATVKTRLILKSAWKGLSTEGCPNWQKVLGT